MSYYLLVWFLCSVARFGEISPFWLVFKAGGKTFFGKSSQAKWLLFGKDQFLQFLFSKTIFR